MQGSSVKQSVGRKSEKPAQLGGLRALTFFWIRVSTDGTPLIYLGQKPPIYVASVVGDAALRWGNAGIYLVMDWRLFQINNHWRFSNQQPTEARQLYHVTCLFSTQKGGNMQNLIEIATELTQAGLSVIPTDAKKIPIGKWGEFQIKIAPPDKIPEMFAHAQAIALIGGKVSENLYQMDFEGKDHDHKPMKSVFPDWSERAQAELTRLGHPHLFDMFVVVKTQNGGHHVRWRVSDDFELKTEKLAQRWSGDVNENGKPIPNLLIESKAEGGYALIPPSPGYELIQGSLTDIPTIPVGIHERLVELAKSFHSAVEEKPLPPTPKAQPTQQQPLSGLSPGDDFNQRGDHHALLTKHGWQLHHEDAKAEYWTRPGKSTKDGHSAVWAKADIQGRERTLTANHFRIFSENASPLEAGESYSLFGLYAWLECDGDFDKATLELAKLGYGDQTLSAAEAQALLASESDPEVMKARVEGWVFDASWWKAADFNAFIGTLSEKSIDGNWIAEWKRKVYETRDQRNGKPSSSKSQPKTDAPPHPNGSEPPKDQTDAPKESPEAQFNEIRREILDAGMMDEGFERTEKTKAIINRLVGFAPVDQAAFIERMRKADLGTKAVLEDQLKSAIKAQAQEKHREVLADIPKIPVGSPIPLTDDWNAVRFVKEHGADVRYSYEWGKWLVYDGRRWKVDAVGEVIARAKQTVRKLYALAAESPDAAERKILANHAKQSDSNVKIKAFLALAESEVPILVSQLDANPMLLNVENGTIDLTTGKRREHHREDYLTKLAPVHYDPNATCDFWHSFLDRIMNGNRELIAFLQRAVGYSLTADVSEQVLFFLYGTGANGKSTFLEATINLLGDYAKNAEPDILMLRWHEVHPTGVADLMGARFVATVEAGEGRRLHEVKVKQLTGGDTLKARFMRQDFFSFKPTHKIFLAANHKPVIRGTDHAIWRRMRLIPFEVTIPEQERIPFGKLMATFQKEAAGILAWAVKGCLDWQANGLGTPEAVKVATEAYRNEMDIIGDFLDEHCILGEGYIAKASNLYAAYKAWCEASGEMPLSQKAFGGRLTERGFTRERRRDAHYWMGIGVCDRSSENPQDAQTQEPRGGEGISSERVTDRDPSGQVKPLENGTSRGYMEKRVTIGHIPPEKDSEPSHGVHSSDVSFSADRSHAKFLHAWQATCGNQMLYAEKLIPLAQGAGFDLTVDNFSPMTNIERILRDLTDETIEGLTVRCLGDGAYQLESQLAPKPAEKAQDTSDVPKEYAAFLLEWYNTFQNHPAYRTTLLRIAKRLFPVKMGHSVSDQMDAAITTLEGKTVCGLRIVKDESGLHLEGTPESEVL